MKDKKENSIKLMVGNIEKESNETFQNLTDEQENSLQKYKKPIIYSLMFIVCLGCFYLIFKPSQDETLLNEKGMNDAVPQATAAGMPMDKEKAYEQEMQALKNQEKQNALTNLADYLNQENEQVLMHKQQEEIQPFSRNNYTNGNNINTPTANSYRNMQTELGSFYQQNNSESTELRKQISDLKVQLANKDVPKPITMNDQIELMEKSYQLAAKYLPTSQPQSSIQKEIEINLVPKSTVQQEKLSKQEKDYFVAVRPLKKNPVSSLFREPEDYGLLIENRTFTTVGSYEDAEQSKNSIRACVHETQVIKGETNVRLRLLEVAQTSQHYFPKGTLITAKAKIQDGRLQLKVSSIELNGVILPVELTIYDLDGQQGLNISDSQEINALTEMAANMSQTSGTSIMLTQSAGQQLATDLSRGVVQGVSGYFSKKIRTPKITLKAGLQVLLVSKKQT